MGRISREGMFMMMARAAQMRATCHRLNVGAIITHQNSPVSVGWNGARPGAPHCAGNACPGIVPGNCGTLHAEANALKKAEALLEVGMHVDLYITHSPCAQCCDAIMKSTLIVDRIFFEVPYRSTQHLGMFSASYAGGNQRPRYTRIYEVTAAGYIVDYFTRKVTELP